jgi:hypothetical protein
MTTALDTNIALVSLAEAQEYLNVTGQNAVLNHLINAASAWVGGYLKRDLVSKARVQYYSGDGDVELVLKDRPISTVTGIWLDALRVFGTDTLIAATDYIVKKDAGIIRAFNLFGNWILGESNIKVSYTAGYTVATDGGSTGTMPYDIRMAVKRLLDNQYRTGYTHRKLDFSSEAISGMNITFKDAEIPKDVKSMLDGWKNSIPAPNYEYAD